jgi:hypothetical protein
MNKAFVREPEDTGELHCPKCGTAGTAVGRETLEAQLATESLARIAESGYFCPSPTCEVAYFDQFGRTVPREAMKRPAYPKDLDAPICGCFGFTRDDVEADVREGVVTRCRDLVAKSKSPAARCIIMAPSGQSCVPEVQRYFMKLRQEREAIPGPG